MERYQQGKIYAIICRKTERRYVGSTYEPTLAKRLAKHVADFKCWLENDKIRYKTSFDIIKDGDYYIVLLESYPCNSKDELRMCEQKHINLNDCVNKNKAFISEEERKEQSNQNAKQYYEKNSDEINAKARERVCCPICQKEINKSSLSRHYKTCPQLVKEMETDVIPFSSK